MSWVGETTVKAAVAPLSFTLVAPLRSVPRILSVIPALPDVGSVLTATSTASRRGSHDRWIRPGNRDVQRARIRVTLAEFA